MGRIDSSSVDSRHAFVKLFLRKGSHIAVSRGVRKKHQEVLRYWGEQGYVVDNNGDFGDECLYFYKSRFASKSVSRPDNEYVIIPGLKEPRWLIRNDSAIIESHGPIIKPSSWFSRLVWWVAICLNRAGWFTLLFPYRLAAHAAPLRDRIKNGLVSEGAIIYTGAPGCKQKFTIQYNDKTGKPVRFLKIAELPHAVSGIRNEIHALRELDAVRGELSAMGVEVPKLEHVVEEGRFLGVVQSSILTNERMSGGFEKQDLEFVLSLYACFRVIVIDAERYLSVTRAKCEELGEVALAGKLVTSGTAASRVYLGVSHGDFMPWNRFINNGVIKVIDWETYGVRPLFYDIIYFVLHKSVLIEGKRVADALVACDKEIEHVLLRLSKTGLSKEDVDVEVQKRLCLVEIVCHYAEARGQRDVRLYKELKSLVLQ